MTEHRGSRWWRDLDAILRRADDQPTPLERSLWRLLAAAACCGAVYGSFVGWFSIKSHGWPGLTQVAAAAVKIPLLFLLTLAVTFPSLYLFSALLDTPMGFRQTLRLLLTAILVTLAAAASFGPILGFFTVSTESYAFMILLNVALLGVAGLIGMAFLVVRLRDVDDGPTGQARTQTPEPAPGEEGAGQDARACDAPPLEGPPESIPPRVAAWTRSRQGNPKQGHSQEGRPRFGEFTPSARRGSGLLQLWIIIYGLVGVQMAWILRPFVGSPDGPLSLFRPIGGNFFEAFFNSLQRFMGL